MSGLAHLLLDCGHAVCGSDLALNEEIRQLRARGALIHIGHQADQLRAARPVLAVYSSAIRSDNPELRAAQELKVPIVRRATLLAALVQRQCGICVAGMHGKTTATALLSFALEQLHARPSYAVGALVPQLGRHARLSLSDRISPAGKPAPDPSEGGEPAPGCDGPLSLLEGELANGGDGRIPLLGGVRGGSQLSSSPLPAVAPQPYFVVEADESDGTLLEFHPEHAIVLNVDAEHLDFYANLEAICREFQTFAQQTRGLLIFCADDPRLAELYAKRRGAISYGFHPLACYR